MIAHAAKKTKFESQKWVYWEKMNNSGKLIVENLKQRGIILGVKVIIFIRYFNSWWPKIVTNLEHFQSSISTVRNNTFQNFFLTTASSGLWITFGHKKIGHTSLIQHEI